MSTNKGKIRTLMGLLTVLMVSGEDITHVESFLGKSVLLPCNCSNRNLDKEFKWQMGQNPPVVIYNGTTSYFHESYTDRAELLLSSSTTCSILLTKITAADQGMYKCIFYIEEQYTYETVNLSVYANYSVPQYAPLTQTGDVKVYQCDVKALLKDTEIDWNLDGQPLGNLSSVNISTTHTLDPPTGFYHFRSKLMTTLNWSSKPECVPKSKPNPKPLLSTQSPGAVNIWALCGAILFAVAVLLLSLFLLYNRKVSGRQKKEEGADGEEGTNMIA